MRKFVKLLNNLFIYLILIIVYFIGVGISFCIAKVFRRSNFPKIKESFWENPQPNKKTADDYESSF